MTDIAKQESASKSSRYRRFIDPNILTFTKEYKGWHIQDVLRIRGMREYLKTKPWIKEKHEYIYNCALAYNPREKFIDWSSIPSNTERFYDTYTMFYLLSSDKINIELRDSMEVDCYEYYYNLVQDLKQRIETRMENELENIYDIKAPTKWLNALESGTDESNGTINRSMFKEFMEAYDLPNITQIVKDIKAAGGIEYKGHDARIISKRNSEEQEKYWESILKGRHGENIGVQFKHENCIFDFINFETKIVYECKLSLNDFDQKQYTKYTCTVNQYKIVYLIAKDCIIDTQELILYTLNIPRYEQYIKNIENKPEPTYLDNILLSCTLTEFDINVI